MTLLRLCHRFYKQLLGSKRARSKINKISGPFVFSFPHTRPLTMNSQSSALQIQTLVFVDLETTDLPRGGNIPRITEFASVAIDRLEFLKSIDNMQQRFSDLSTQDTDETQISNEPTLIKPRILNKIVQAINPEIHINPVASRISGLNLTSLSSMPTFHEFGPVLKGYLETLPKPVCLIAHNGQKFDFPILKGECQRVGIENIGPGIYVADSIEIFKQIDQRWKTESAVSSVVTNITETVLYLEENPIKNGSALLSDAYMTQSIYRSRYVSIDGTPGSHYEISPPRLSQPNVNRIECTPPNDSATADTMLTSSNHVRRQLFNGANSNSPAKTRILASQRNGSRTNGTHISYALGSIYQRMFGSNPPDHHSAEGDCLSLLQIAGQYGEEFVYDVGANARPLEM